MIPIFLRSVAALYHKWKMKRAARCMDCGLSHGQYHEMLFPRSQWLMINPKDAGMLCANCMLARAAKLPGQIGVVALVTFSGDLTGELLDTPYFQVTRLAESIAAKRKL